MVRMGRPTMISAMRHFRLLVPALLLGSLTLWPACQLDDDYDRLQAPDWHPTLAAPLVNTSLTLGDLLEAWGESQWIETDESGLISLVYEEEILRASWSELLGLPDRTIPMPDTLVTMPVVLPDVQMVRLKAGTFTYHMQSGLNEPVEVMIQIEGMRGEEEIFERFVTLPDAGPASGSFSLAEQELHPEAGALTFRYRARRLSTGEIIPLQACSYRLEDLAYRYAEGYFGRLTFSLGADSIGVNIGSNLVLEDLELSDPRVRFTVANSYGIPIRIDANDLTVLAPTGQATTFSLGDSMAVAYPSLAEVGATLISETEINRDNSDIVAALRAGIASLSWAFTAVTHPDGREAGGGFILDTSRLAVNLGVEVPLHGRVARCQVVEQVEADLSDLDFDPLQAGTLKLIVANRFPFSLGVQVRFLDGEGGLIDSLFADQAPLLLPAPVDTAGLVTAAATHERLIALPAHRLAALPRTRYLEVVATFVTSGDGQVPVKLTEACGLSIQLGAIGQL